MKAVWKWLIGIVAFIIIALLGASWYLSRNWKPLMEDKLSEMIKNASDSLYTLTYDDLDVNFALGNVTLKNVLLSADSNVYAQLESIKKAPDNRYNIKMSALKIKRFGIMDILRSRKLTINSIALESPEVEITNKYHAYNDTLSNEPKKTLYESVKDVLSSVNVEDVTVDQVQMKYVKLDNGKSSEFSLKDVRVRVHDILIDETSASDSTRFYHTKMVEVDLPGFEYEFANGFYMAKFDSLKINTRDRNVLLTNVDYKPVMNKAAYFKKRGKNQTMAVLHFDTLRIEDLNFQKLIENQQTIAKKIQLKNGFAKLYGDKRYPKSPKNQIGQAPHQKLMRVKSLINIDTVLVDNITVEYGEMSGKYHEEGVITFNGSTGYLSNVTNDSLALKANRFTKADLRTRVMNSGNLHAQFSFDMLSKAGDYTYKGSLGAMKATSFNKILQPLLNVKIASGNIYSMRFDLAGTDHRTRGDFRFNYDNLQIELLNEKGEDGVQTSKKVLSFLVNKVIINDGNPDANEVYHVGRVNYQRVPEHTFFKNLWQGLLDGIKQTAGISKDREDQLRRRGELAKRASENAKQASENTKGFFKRVFGKKKSNEDK